MAERSLPIQKATLTLIGTIIGAGVFGLPLVIYLVGFWPGTLLFVILTAVVWATHLLYAEVCLAYRKKMRLAGYASQVLGKIGYRIASVTHPLQIIGANIVYLVLGGEFLATMLIMVTGRNIDPLILTVLLFVAGGLIILVGLKFMATVETVATWFLIASLLVVTGLLYQPALLLPIPASHWPLVLAPFGIFLFTLSGFPVIAEVVEIAERKRRTVYAAITIGTLVAALLSWLFGVCLAIVAPSASWLTVQNLPGLMPCGWAWLLPLVGFLAVATSYITTAQELKATFRHDFGYSREIAWAATILIPFLLVFVVPRDFILLVGLIGTVFGGINGILIAVISYRVVRKEPKGKHWLLLLAFAVAVAYSAGMLYQIISPKL